MRDYAFRKTSVLAITLVSLVLYLVCFVLLYYTVEDDVRREARADAHEDVRSGEERMKPGNEAVSAHGNTTTTEDKIHGSTREHHVRLVT